MRISDWSSDVCSSDLRMAEEGADLALVARGKDKLEAVAAEARATGTQVLTHAVDVGDLDAYVAAIEATARHFRRIDAIVNNAMHDVSGPVAEISLDVRSEAHTSELQSLMRISSAVVFL